MEKILVYGLTFGIGSALVANIIFTFLPLGKCCNNYFNCFNCSWIRRLN